MRVSQGVLDPRCQRVRTTEHAPRRPFRVLERGHGLAEIVERGRVVLEWSDAEIPRGTLTVEKLLDLAGELPRLTLALDLKGSTTSAYPTYLARLRDMVARRRLQRRAWVWVDSAEAVAALGPSNGVRFGKPLRDGGDAQADCASQLEAADARRFEFLGPSVTCASARFFAAAAAAPWRRAPRHLLVWTVDEGAALRALLSRGADDVSVVSNAPFALQEELEALRAERGCRIKHT